MRPRVVLLASLAAVVATSILLVPAARAQLVALGSHAGSRGSVWMDPSASPTGGSAQIGMQPAPPGPALRAPANPATIKVSGTSLFGWAFLDRGTGKITGSANMASVTNTTESMIKAWIASDYLRLATAAGQQPSKTTLGELTLMIIDSNDDMAEKYYDMDGYNDVVNRLISMCGLTGTQVYPYYWSRTTMTPQDAVRYGLCVADGRAAGPKWTTWILNTMKNVRGGVGDQVDETKQGGRWGVIDALPAQLASQTSIKNGWTSYVDGWHINCLAINPNWVLNVMTRTPTLPAGANVCKSVASQLLYTPDSD